MKSPERSLDDGGFARLDVSDLSPAEEVGEDEAGGGAPETGPCDWCASAWRGGGAYLVVADNRHHRVCPTCWGRSPGYLELRQSAAVGHQEALSRLGVGEAAAA